MNIITAGFCGTGSSAVEDVLLEYDCCTVGNYSRFEHVLFYIPDGLFDLEDRMVYNNSFHMFDGAIKRFYQAMRRLNDQDFHWFGGYGKRTGNKFMTIVDEFVDSLAQYQTEGYWSDDITSVRTVKGTVKDILVTRRLFDRANGMRNKVNKADDNKIYFSFITREQFLEKARIFVKKYIELIREGCREEHFVFDQLILPQHIGRVRDYFDCEDTRVILVDRDARDLYVLSKYVWPYQSGKSNKYFPDDVENFISFHRGMRRDVVTQDTTLLKIQFEDLIYNYEDTLQRIEEFLRICSDAHIKKGQCFQVEKSIKNTQNFLINAQWHEEVKIISEQMPEYIYDFPYTIAVDISETSDP